MGTVTNISGEDLTVSLLEHRIVKAGETVEVHDDLLHAHDESCGADVFGTSTREHCDKHGFVWPEATWKTTASKTKAKSKTDTAAAGTQE
jgi:hypothetical protein